MNLGGTELARRTVGLARHVRRDCSRGVTSMHLLEDARRFFKRADRGRILSWPRHSLRLYDELLVRLRSLPQCRFLSLEAHVRKTSVERDAIGVVLRHDVDTGDARGLAALCEIEARLSITSSVHILVDDALYRCETVAPLAKELGAAGFDVGLHTQAWMHPDYVRTFFTEVARFGDLMQFLPKTITLHGAWPRSSGDLARRRRFLRDLPTLLQNTSIVGHNNHFDWVSEDSNIQGRPAPIRESFLQPDLYCYLGGVALILTHDAHWAPNR